MILSEYPYPWNSVHRPVPYVYNHESRTSYAIADVAGKLQFIVTAFTFTPVAGEIIAVEKVSAGYNTYHTVVSVSGGSILTDSDYSDFQDSVPGGATVLYVRLPQIKLYAGYALLEEYPTELPLTLVATFYPENSPENDVRIDVSEYLKSIFRILPPTEGIDFNMFNRFRLHFDGTYKEFFQVLNSSIKTEDLNSIYVNTGAYLNSKVPPVVFGCGKTILSTLTGTVVINSISDDADITNNTGDYNNDFLNDFFIQ